MHIWRLINVAAWIISLEEGIGGDGGEGTSGGVSLKSVSVEERVCVVVAVSMMVAPNRAEWYPATRCQHGAAEREQ